MKINQYIRKSLSRQALALMSFFIIMFIAGTAALYLTQQHLNNEYFKERAELVKKEALVRDIDDTFNLVFFDVRGYLALENKDLKANALSRHPEIRESSKKLEKMVTSNEDREFINHLRSFTDYYFVETLPVVLRDFELGHKDKVIKLANEQATSKVNSFQEELNTYIDDINEQLDGKVVELTRKQSLIQWGFIGFILLILLVFFRITRIMFKQVGQPLAQFAYAANEITKGKEAEIRLDSNREDELGVLAIAFKKMIYSVQEKEQDLLAQNEELVAQQDELQAQQTELEEMLETVQENQWVIQRRNDLTNGISNSLDRQEVLESIVINMSKVIKADCGMIAMTRENAHAAFGVSPEGVKQFQDNLLSGFQHKILIMKKPSYLKREAHVSEKGYHEGKAYVYDLYIPVLSSDNEVLAIMAFSRYGDPFLEKHMDEYEALAKQVGISLDKISLFEQSEADRKLNQDILNTIKEGIQLVDTHGTILQVNEKLCELIDCPSIHEMIGLPWDNWIYKMKRYVEDEEVFVDHFVRAVQSDIASEENSFIYKKKDSNQVIKVYFEGLYKDEQRVGTVVVHRDITKEFEVDQIKSEFVSTVSHELRTPLASILGFTELMLNRQLKTDRQKKYLTTIYNEAKRLTSLINDFLDVQRMEAGKQTYEKKYIQLTPIISKIIESQQVNTHMHHISLENEVANDVVLGDRSKIEQVFMNLINNAVKYSPDGGEIHIKVYFEDQLVKVDIKDPGLGIPEDAIDKLFTKFYRVDNTDRRRIGGTGLGLAIVNEIMKAHGGDVKVSSVYGEGSTFTLSFPAVEVGSDEDNQVQGLMDKSHNYRIMVVEDDLSLADLICQELNESGFQVVHYKSAKDALEALSSESPDAIVLDILLDDEEFDGWKMMNLMKSNEQLKNVPIIVSSALDEKEKGFSLGANDYLVKPYKPSHLSKAIMQTLLKMGKIGQILVPDADEDK